jgi:hypothetical protein
MKRRLRIKHAATFAERLASEARRLKELARRTPQGPDREMILRKVRQVETASHVNDWLMSPDVEPRNSGPET